MKKIELYELYKLPNLTKGALSSQLYNLFDLGNDEANLLFKICINNKNTINDNNFSKLVKIFEELSVFEFLDNKIEFCDMLNDFISKDYISSSESFCDILDFISELISYPINMILCVEPEQCEYYILEIIKFYFSMFDRDVNDYENIYSHNFDNLSEKYRLLLENLINTEVKFKETLEENIFNRIKIVTKIASDSKLIKLDEEKFNSIIDVAISITNMSELMRFKKALNFIPKDIPYSDFQKIVESYSSNLSYNTINLLLEQLKIDIDCTDSENPSFTESNIDNDKQDHIIKNILTNKPKTNLSKNMIKIC